VAGGGRLRGRRLPAVGRARAAPGAGRPVGDRLRPALGRACADGGPLGRPHGRALLLVACGQFLVCGLLSLAAALLSEPLAPDRLLAATGPILYTGVLSVGVAFTAQVVAQRYARGGRGHHPVVRNAVRSRLRPCAAGRAPERCRPAGLRADAGLHPAGAVDAAARSVDGRGAWPALGLAKGADKARGGRGLAPQRRRSAHAILPGRTSRAGASCGAVRRCRLVVGPDPRLVGA
jgi:hypothetical protein